MLASYAEKKGSEGVRVVCVPTGDVPVGKRPGWISLRNRMPLGPCAASMTEMCTDLHDN